VRALPAGAAWDDKDERTARTTPLAAVPWRADMGAWQPLSWAWLLALLYRKAALRCTLRTVSLTYKAQDAPTPNFRAEVETAFHDVCRTARIAPDAAPFTRASFTTGSLDLDQHNDLAFLFDTQLWCVAADLGFDIQDRSRAPARMYHIGDAHVALDCARKRWASAEAYVRGRLGGAARHASLSAEDAAKHTDFIWELLASQTIRISDQESMPQLWDAYKAFSERRLGRALRKVAVRYAQPVPAAAAAHTTRRCDACGATEGAARDAAGGLGAKLRSCACCPGAVPYYCNEHCQKAGWPAHREFCTAAPPAGGGGKSGKSSKGSKGKGTK
jgi:hypothetical protein